MKIQIKDYQEKAIQKLLSLSNKVCSEDSFKSTKTLKSPTGSGKTIIAAKYIDDFKAISNNIRFIWLTSGGSELSNQSCERVSEVLKDLNQSKIVKNNLNCIQLKDVIEEIDGSIKFSVNNILFLDLDNIYKDYSKGKFKLEKIINYINQSTYRKIILIIDECHKYQPKLKKLVSETIKPRFCLNMSATIAIKKNDVEITYDEVKNEEMIRNRVLVQTTSPNVKVENDDGYLCSAITNAINQQEYLSKLYVKHTIDVNPLCIIQICCKDTNGEIQKSIEKHLEKMHITILNGKLAYNCTTISSTNNILNDTRNYDINGDAGHDFKLNTGKPIVLIIKRKFLFGWDCPRAQIIVKINNNNAIKKIEKQLIGRILRTPELKFYYNEDVDNNEENIEKKELDNAYIYYDTNEKCENLTIEDEYSIVENKSCNIREELVDCYLGDIHRLEITKGKEIIIIESLEQPKLQNGNMNYEHLKNVVLNLRLHSISKRKQGNRKFLDVKFKEIFKDQIEKEENIQNVNSWSRNSNHLNDNEIIYYGQIVNIDKLDQTNILNTGHFVMKGLNDNEMYTAFYNKLVTIETQDDKKPLGLTRAHTTYASCIIDVILTKYDELCNINDGKRQAQILFLNNFNFFNEVLRKTNKIHDSLKGTDIKSPTKLYIYNLPIYKTYPAKYIESTTLYKKYAYDRYYTVKEESNLERLYQSHLEDDDMLKWWNKTDGQSKKGYNELAIKYLTGDEYFYINYVAKYEDGTTGLIISIEKGSLKGQEKFDALMDYIKSYSTKENPLIGTVIRNNPNDTYKIIAKSNGIYTDNLWNDIILPIEK